MFVARWAGSYDTFLQFSGFESVTGFAGFLVRSPYPGLAIH
jgi:hypothetical protein